MLMIPDKSAVFLGRLRLNYEERRGTPLRAKRREQEAKYDVTGIFRILEMVNFVDPRHGHLKGSEGPLALFTQKGKRREYTTYSLLIGIKLDHTVGDPPDLLQYRWAQGFGGN